MHVRHLDLLLVERIAWPLQLPAGLRGKAGA